jgi:hypothetical protein
MISALLFCKAACKPQSFQPKSSTAMTTMFGLGAEEVAAAAEEAAAAAAAAAEMAMPTARASARSGGMAGKRGPVGPKDPVSAPDAAAHFLRAAASEAGPPN